MFSFRDLISDYCQFPIVFIWLFIYLIRFSKQVEPSQEEVFILLDLLVPSLPLPPLQGAALRLQMAGGTERGKKKKQTSLAFLVAPRELLARREIAGWITDTAAFLTNDWNLHLAHYRVRRMDGRKKKNNFCRFQSERDFGDEQWRCSEPDHPDQNQNQCLWGATQSSPQLQEQKTNKNLIFCVLQSPPFYPLTSQTFFYYLCLFTRRNFYFYHLPSPPAGEAAWAEPGGLISSQHN